MPDPLWTVIERCLRKNPEERPSAENLARGLRAVAEGIGVHANSAQIAAAEGVGALLMPDPAPAQVPGAADPTQVLPSNAGSYDPNAATSVMQSTGTGDADPTSVLPNRGAADPTAVMPPVPPHQPGANPDDPHPWQNQMRAARDRNEQTQVQYLDPNDDPLRRHRSASSSPSSRLSSSTRPSSPVGSSRSSSPSGTRRSPSSSSTRRRSSLASRRRRSVSRGSAARTG